MWEEWWVKQDWNGKATRLNTNVSYYPGPVWPIIPLSFITLVTFDIWSWNFTYYLKIVVFMMSKNIGLLYCTILKILFICYTLLFLDRGTTGNHDVVVALLFISYCNTSPNMSALLTIVIVSNMYNIDKKYLKFVYEANWMELKAAATSSYATLFPNLWKFVNHQAGR